MDIKIISAQHAVKNENSFQQVKRITNNSFDGEIWLIAGFKQKSEAVKEIFQKTISAFESSFFDKENESDFENLEDVIKEINENAQKDYDNLDEQLLRDGGIFIGFFGNNALHFTICGNPEIYFMRKGGFSKISEGLYEYKKNGDLFANVASGDLKDDDKIIFTTTRLLRFATSNQIIDATSSGSLEAIESLKLMIPDNEEILVVFFHIKGVETLPFTRKENKGFFANIPEKKHHQSSRALISARNFWDKIFNFSHPNKNIFIFSASIIGLVLIASFIGLLSGQKNNEDVKKYTQRMEEVKQNLILADNRRMEGKIDEANLLIEKIDNEARQIYEAGLFRDEVLQIINQTQDMKDVINNITRISGARIVTNMKQISENVDLKGILEFNGERFVFDNNYLYEILSASGEIKNSYKLPEREELLSGIPFSTKSGIVFLTKSGKIIEFANENVSYASTSDNAFKNANAISTFSKYLYLLDPENSQIWKYEKRDKSFATAQEYNLDADLSSAISIAIDGNIFVLTSDGEIIKMLRGKKVNYAIRNAPENSMSGLTKIYTTSELNKLYLLNKAKNSILVFSKGENEAYYERQIMIEDASEIRDFWVNPVSNYLFYVDSEKLYEFGL